MESGPVQIFPPGLLGLLQLKNQGRNPDKLPDTLQSTIELRDWLFQSGAVDLGAQVGGNGSLAAAAGAAGYGAFTTNPIVVPVEQYWYVIDYQVETANLVATDAVAFGCAYSTYLTGNIQRYGVGERQPLLQGAAVARRGMAHAHGFFVPPGGQLGVNIEVNDTATSVTYVGYVRYVPLVI